MSRSAPLAGASPALYLASQSAQRSQLLGQLGLDFRVLAIDVPEQVAPDESAEHYVQRVAADKARAGAAQARASWVLAADTEVVLEHQVFGKPADAEAARAMLERLSGREHTVLSAVHLWGPAGEEARALCRSTVRMAPLDAGMIETYIASGEPFGKAGAYAIQGRGAAFVTHLQGSYSGVMGLPLFETAHLLRRYGVLP